MLGESKASGKPKSAFALWANGAITYCVQHGVDASMRLLGPVLSSLAVLLIGFVVYVFFADIAPTYSSRAAIPIILVGLTILFNLVFNYFAAALLGPGRPPPGSEYPAPHVMEALKDDPDLRHNDGKTHRFCSTCKAAKPMRTHHCSICKRCSYKMDHHCPWLNTCVGYRNWKHFLLFLLYLYLGTLFVAVTGGNLFVAALPGKTVAAITSSTLQGKATAAVASGAFMFVYLLILGINVAMMGFVGWTGYLLLTNQTTIEFYSNSFDRDKRWQVAGWENPYDLGSWRRNAEQVFGTGPLWTWLLPSLRPPPGDGLVFALDYRPTAARIKRLAAAAAAAQVMDSVAEEAAISVDMPDACTSSATATAATTVKARATAVSHTINSESVASLPPASPALLSSSSITMPDAAAVATDGIYQRSTAAISVSNVDTPTQSAAATAAISGAAAANARMASERDPLLHSVGAGAASPHEAKLAGSGGRGGGCALQ